MATLSLSDFLRGSGGLAPGAAVPLSNFVGNQQPVQSQPSTTVRPQATARPTLAQARGAGSPTEIQQAGLINSLLQNAGKLGNLFSPGLTQNIGGSGFNLADISGPLSLASGVSRGNVGQSIGGGLSTLGTFARMGGMPNVAKGLGALGGPLSLAMGIQGKNPLGIASGALSTATTTLPLLANLASQAGILPQSLGWLAGAGGGVTGLAANALSNLAPSVAAAIANTFGTAGSASASMGASGLSAALAPALSGVAAAAAPIIMAITSYLSNKEEMNARSSGWWNNPIKGQLYSNATAGVAAANKGLEAANKVGLQNIPTETMMKNLPKLVDSLVPYYATAQGGRGAVRASETAGSPGTQSKAEYTANFTKARDGVSQVVQELMKRGVSYEDLGKLQVSGNWALQSLDAGGTPQEYINRSPRAGELLREGQGLFGRFNLANYDPYRGAFGADTSWQSDFGPNGLNTPEGQRNFLLQQALGASMAADQDVTKASGLYTSMYGGPLWAALARMGAPQFSNLIAQKFDPWVLARTWKPDMWVKPTPSPYALDPSGQPLTPEAWGTGISSP